MRDCIELFSEPRAIFSNRFEQRRVGQSLQHVRCDGGDERTTAKSGSVISRLNRRSDIPTHENGTHWKSARQRLGEGKHVWNYSASFVSEQMPSPSEPALDLVENERDLTLGGKRPQLFEKGIIEDAYSSLALHRLDNQRCDRFFV